MQTVLVTGAAKGIGYAVAQRFAREGWFVGLFDIDAASCKEHVASGDFPQAIAGFCDVTDMASIRGAMDEFSEATGGRLDVLVNNAGVLSAGEFADMSVEQLDAMINVNVRGLTQVARAAYPMLEATANSVLVNLCSSSSIHGVPLLAVYSATKFYVNGLTQALNIEWADNNIHVTSIKPPPVNTAMGHQLDPRHLDKMAIDNEPEDVADAVWSAVQRKPLHIIMGVSTKIWYWLTKLLPAAGGKWLMRTLLGN